MPSIQTCSTADGSLRKKTLYIVIREVCTVTCWAYIDKVMTVPPYPKNGNWQMVSSKSGAFLNNVATIDDKHIAIRKRTHSDF